MDGLGGLDVPADPAGQRGQPALTDMLRAGKRLVVDHDVGGGDIFQKVDEHRAGPAGGGYGEGLPDDVRDSVRVPDQIGGLGDGHGDSGDVHLLERVLTQDVLRDVAGDEHYGGGVVIGGGDAGGQVGGPGAGGGKAYAHLAGGAGIAVGCVGRALLVGGQIVIDLTFIIVELIIEIENGAAGIAEDGIHLLFQQTLHDSLCRANLQVRVPPLKPLNGKCVLLP